MYLDYEDMLPMETLQDVIKKEIPFQHFKGGEPSAKLWFIGWLKEYCVLHKIKISSYRVKFKINEMNTALYVTAKRIKIN